MPRKSATVRRVGELTSLETDQRFVLSVENGPGQSYGKRWCIMFDEARQQVAHQLTEAATLRVFLVLPDHLNWLEFRSLNQRDLAADLKISPASVSRAMKDLLNRSMVERSGRGPVMKWRLSLNWGWRGNAAAFHAAVRESERVRVAGVVPTDLPAPNAAEGIDCKPPLRAQKSLTLLRRVSEPEPA